MTKQQGITVTGGYPLEWPPGRHKIEPRWRDRSAFRQRTPGAARQFVIDEIERFGGDDVVISTNIPLRKDGLPYSGGFRLDDEAVAIYFTRDGKRLCFACDRWGTMAENFHAIGKTIEAIRGIARWGSGDMMESAVGGFASLPAPGAKREWWEVLGVDRSATREAINSAYRVLASKYHPDKPGGSHEKMAELNQAKEAALRECAP
jgi:hypothetical protein